MVILLMNLVIRIIISLLLLRRPSLPAQPLHLFNEITTVRGDEPVRFIVLTCIQILLNLSYTDKYIIITCSHTYTTHGIFSLDGSSRYSITLSQCRVTYPNSRLPTVLLFPLLNYFRMVVNSTF